jgi:hypothetical protein
VATVPLTVLWPAEAFTAKKQQWKNVDIIGALLLVCGSCLLVFVLNQVGADFYGWHDPTVVVCFAIAGLSSVLFVVWMALLSRGIVRSIDAIFPAKIALKRPTGPAIL